MIKRKDSTDLTKKGETRSFHAETSTFRGRRHNKIGPILFPTPIVVGAIKQTPSGLEIRVC